MSREFGDSTVIIEPLFPEWVEANVDQKHVIPAERMMVYRELERAEAVIQQAKEDILKNGIPDSEFSSRIASPVLNAAYRVNNPAAQISQGKS